MNPLENPIALVSPASAFTNTKVASFVTPFDPDNLQSVFMQIRKQACYGSDYRQVGYKIVFEATVRFERGASKGQQELIGESLQDLVDKVNAFLAGL